MKNICITDVTMRQSRRGADFSLSFREKIELAKLLDRLGVTAIETTPISAGRIDILLIKSIASAVKESTVAVPVGLELKNIDIAIKALSEARHPRLVIEAPVSAVQMEYIAGKKPAAMLGTIKEMITAAKAVCPQVEFVAEDATRADRAFLTDALKTALDADVDIITLGDAAGNMLPDEFGGFVSSLQEEVPGLKDISLGVSCSNELSLADACAVAALLAGAGELKAAACNLNSVSLKHIAALIAAKGDALDACTSVRTTQLNRSVEQIRRLCRSTGSSDVLAKASGDNSGIFLTAHDDISAVLKVAAEIGYELSEEDGIRVYEAFMRIASRKEKVSAKELDAIIASAAMQVPPTYTVEKYVINSGNAISASAYLKLKKSDEFLEAICLGDGPIDAAFHSISEIIGHHYELDEFQIQAVTEGREAMGEAVVKLRSAGKLYSGQGISTDIIGASIRAYINAVNKIVYESGNN